MRADDADGRDNRDGTTMVANEYETPLTELVCKTSVDRGAQMIWTKLR